MNQTIDHSPKKILFLVTEDWYFCSHRLPIARMAKKSGFDVTVATRVTNHGGQILEEGFNLIPLHMRRSGHGLVGELFSFLEIVKVFRKEKPDIVHLVAMKPVFFGGMSLLFSRSTVIINALTGLGHLFTSKRKKIIVLRKIITIFLKKLLTRPGSWVIVQNAEDRDIIAGIMSKNGNNITLIPGSGVDLSQFLYFPELDSKITVCMVSRMLWDKGVGVLVDAARMVKEAGTDIRVILIGTPDMDNPGSVSEKQLQEWHDSGVVEWLGRRDDIPEILAQSHIAVLPSYYGEGVPKTLLEAAACGRAMITTDSPGCNDVVKHGETGLLVPRRDAEALAKAIIKLAVDPTLRKQMGAAGHNRVKELYSEDMVIRETEMLYRKALNDRWPS